MDRYEITDDMILPEGFDADAINAAEEGSVGDVIAAGVAPTIEEPAAEESVIAGETPTEETVDTSALETTLEAQMPQTIRVKYNHEERELGLDEAAIYAQKGMNYDKLDERFKALEATNARNERLAKQLGYESAAEMIEAAEKNYVDRQVRELVNAGNTEAMARFLVEQKMAKAAADVPAPEVQPQEEPAPAPQSKPLMSPQRKAELDEFVRAFPGVTKLPDEVLTANRNGVRLKTAYENYQLKLKYDEQQKQLGILKQNQTAAEHAPVTGTIGKAAPKKEEAEDPFLKGFDADY